MSGLDPVANEPVHALQPIASEPTLIQRSPRISSPLDEDEFSDSKSRKREREVSLEPSTPQTGVIDIDKGGREMRETRTPKKNRVQLDATAEEEDPQTPPRSEDSTPPLSASPLYEIKVRQISQGVEDIHWQNRSVVGHEEIDQQDPPQSPGSQQEDKVEEIMPSQDTQLSTPPVISTQLFDVEEPPASFINTQSTLPDAPDSQTVRLSPNTAEENIVSTEQLPSTRPVPYQGSVHQMGLEQITTEENQDPLPSDPVTHPSASTTSDALKRPREDADKGDNPRETKRPSPPPDQCSIPATSTIPKLSGFMAYASSSSPFAAVKGQSLFSSPKKPSIFGAASPSPSTSTLSSAYGQFTTSASDSKDAGITQSVPATAVKRTGFEAFAGSASPFASLAQSRPPALFASQDAPSVKRPPTRWASTSTTSAFSLYASAKAHPFATPSPKRARAASPNGSSLERTGTPSDFDVEASDDLEDEDENREPTFGEKLRAARDDLEEGRSDEEQAKPALTETQIETGEEEEETVRQVRGKLFHLSPDNQWKERGTGTLKLNVRAIDGGGARLVMRKEAVYTVILNIRLFRGMRYFLSQDPRYIRFSAIEGGKTTHYNLRVANAKIAEDLLEDLNNNVPL